MAEVAAEHGIPLKTVHITDRDTAQNLPAPVTTYALFWDGKFVTHAIQSDKKFLKLAQGKMRGVTLDQKKCNVCLKSDPNKCKNRP